MALKKGTRPVKTPARTVKPRRTARSQAKSRAMGKFLGMTGRKKK